MENNNNELHNVDQTNINSVDFEANKPYFPPHLPFSLEGHWQPWFDDRRDYNTNAPTYYDYLANFNHLIHSMCELLNRVARRNIKVEDTNCVDLTKIYDWICEDNPCKTYHDEIILKADVILSTYKKALEFDGHSFNLENALSCLPSGLYAPNYMPLLEDLLAKINQEILDRIEADQALERRIEQERLERIEGDNILNNKIDREISDRINGDNALAGQLAQVQNALTKLLQDLKGSGAWSSGDNILEGNLNSNRHLATGNVNLFTGSCDSGTYIRTNNGQTENDATIGARG